MKEITSFSHTANNHFYAHDFSNDIKPCFVITKIFPHVTEVGTSIYFHLEWLVVAFIVYTDLND